MHTITIGRCACGRRATLYDGQCGFCEATTSHGLGSQDDYPAHPTPSAPLTVSRALEMLVAELAAEEIAAPLAQRLTLASVAADLCRLAGERIPDAVADALDGPGHAPHPQRETHREPAHTAA